ncbi:MAG: AI-2E family transporter [Limnohabitans sp.]|nr:AI-2E family transporter [Limnohabitans sp.]
MYLSPDYRFYAAWLLIGSLLAALLWWLTPVLTPFLIAAVIAYVLSPLVERLQSLMGSGVPRFVTVLVCEVAFLLLLVSFAGLIVPVLFKEAGRLQTQLPGLLAQLQTAVTPLLQSMGIELQLDPQGIKDFVATQAQSILHNSMDSVLSSLRIGGSVALALIGNLILVPVALFYLLTDGPHMLAHLREWVPRKVEPSVTEFVMEADKVLGEYLRGQLLVMLSLSVYYVAGLTLFGLSVAVPIGILTGMAVFVPYVGFGVGLLLAALSGFLEMAPLQASVMLAVVFGIGQLLEGFVLTPRLIGERIGLHPLAVIFALLAFAQLLGFAGVLMALPASAVLLVALRRLRRRYVASRLYAD